jgi:hypothetical protein
LNCTRPLDALDLEAIASGEEPLVAPDALGHAGTCEDCAGRLAAFRALGAWLGDLAGPEVPEAFAPGIERRRGFSAREKRSIALWKGPAALFGALLGGSGILLSMPIFGGSDQAGLLSAMALEWRSAASWPLSAVRALPASVTALSELLLRDRALAAFSILAMLPAGFAVSRLWARRSLRP